MSEIRLYEHNRQAYEAAERMLEADGRAAVVHPTGTGKSFIGFKLSEVHPESRVCWLSPSEYIIRTQVENLRAVTDGECPENIEFLTYAKLMLYSPRQLSELAPDYIVLDEFHRCGAELWGKGVQRLLSAYPRAKVLGLSATNIRYLDNQRDMASELFYGNVASHMTLGEAIARGILNPPKYVLSAYSYQQELERYERLVQRSRSRQVRIAGEKHLAALRRAIERADGLDEIFRKHMDEPTGKYIVFCSNKAHMDEMMSHVGEWFAKVDGEPHVYSLYSVDTTTSRSYQAFKEDEDADHLRLLFTINALNEGIHVPDVSGVILLRPTTSPIIYKQQIGRALSAVKDHTAVIFDVVMNIDYLHSIGAVEAQLQEALLYCASEGEAEEVFRDRFRIIDEVRPCMELFARLNETLCASWDYMYEEAERYHAAHGDLNVPSRYVTSDGYPLGTWLTTQRQVYAGTVPGRLTEKQIEKLNGLGMRWESASDRTWEQYYEAAKEYYRTHGDLEVKAAYMTEEGLPLGRWITNLRSARKERQRSRMLTPERVRALDAVGMIWDSHEAQWQTSYAAAEEYFAAHGDLNVPLKYVTEEGFRLGRWVQQLRNRRHQGAPLSEERVRQLELLGMRWETKSSRQWETGWSELSDYVTENASADVPMSYISPSGYKLGAWVSDQRERYRSGRMPKSRIERLEQLGMSWTREDPWEVRYTLAKAYYDEHQNLRVPAKLVINGVRLNKWLNEQKQIYLGKRVGKVLTREQISRLTQLGFEWPERVG